MTISPNYRPPTIKCPHCGIRNEYLERGEYNLSEWKEAIKQYFWVCPQCGKRYLLIYHIYYIDSVNNIRKIGVINPEKVDLKKYELDGYINCIVNGVRHEESDYQCDKCGKYVKFLRANLNDYCNSKALVSCLGSKARFKILCANCLRDVIRFDKNVDTDNRKWNSYYSWSNLWERKRSAFPCFFFKSDDSDRCHLQVTTGADNFNNVLCLLDYFNKTPENQDIKIDSSIGYTQSIENLTGIKLSDTHYSNK